MPSPHWDLRAVQIKEYCPSILGLFAALGKEFSRLAGVRDTLISYGFVEEQLP